MKTKIEKFFKIKENNSSIQTEIFSGLTAFFTMVYLLFLVPNTIMGAFPEAFNEAGEMVGSYVLNNGLTADEMLVSLTIAACVAAAISTLITALKTGLPFAQGPSLAIATFITYTVCGEMGYTYEQALAAVFISGIVFFILTMFGLEHKIRKAIPHNIKYAVTAGIGLFIAFMGMQKCHMVVADSHHLVKFVNFAGFSDYNTMSTLLCLAGLVLIAVMHYKHIHGAILIGKIIVILAAIPLGLYHHGEINLFAYDFGVIIPTAFKMDFAGLFTRGGDFSLGAGLIITASIVVTLCIMNVFETMSTVIATDHILDHRVHHEQTNEKIKKITGVENKLYRAPYGEYNNTVIKAAKENGYIPIQWSLDTIDYTGITGEEMWNRIEAKIKEGDIILSHNGTKHTADSLEMLIKNIKEKGFEIVKVSDLIYQDNYKIDINGTQIKDK